MTGAIGLNIPEDTRYKNMLGEIDCYGDNVPVFFLLPIDENQALDIF